MINVTLLELVDALSDETPSDTEVVAAVVHLVNSGIVRLCGNFRGARFDLRDFAGSRLAVPTALEACVAVG